MIIIDINRIYQLFTTFLSLILTAILPLLIFFQIGTTLAHLVPNATFIMIMVIIIGALASLARYCIYRYPQYSKQRALFSLINSLSIIIYFGLFSFFTSLETTIPENCCPQDNSPETIISISFQGMFLLLDLPWIVFLIRDVYNLADFSLHESDYIKIVRKENYELKAFVRCSKCGYTVKSKLKRCPRCHWVL